MYLRAEKKVSLRQCSSAFKRNLGFCDRHWDRRLERLHFDIERVKLSMKLGGEYRLRNIRIHHWRKLAEELHADADRLIQRTSDCARQLVDHIPDIRRRMAGEGIAHPSIARLSDQLTVRATTCQGILHSA